MKISSLPQMKITPEEDKKLRDVSRQFEALLVNDLVGQMRKTVQKGGYIPESHAERIYQSLLDSEYATAISQSDQVGLSKMVYEQLLRRLTPR